jgi:HipA-like C-terminal domain
LLSQNLNQNMRPKLNTARDLLPTLLHRNPGVRSAQLAELAKVSPATMVRMLREAGQEVIRIGQTSSTRYFLRRSLRGMDAGIPVYAVDTLGQAAQVGWLELIAPGGCLMDVQALGWPVGDEFAQGVWSDGLPYPLQDMRPQGFLGRQFALQESGTLGVPANPKDWKDDDVLYALLQKGADTTGNLILGDVALQRWLQSKTALPLVLDDQSIEAGYGDYATQSMSQGLAGSSAAGEFPKFTALRNLAGAQTEHVIVKYTAADASATVTRWADLLVCEHLALKALNLVGQIPCAKSRVLQMGGRTFLEVERFDRHGLFGRTPLCSLETIEASLLPSNSRDWGDAAQMLHGKGWLSSEAVLMVQVILWFGRLIGNSDMHRGNLSFVPGNGFQVAPVYDMLPMMFAPLQGGEIPNATYAPELPMPAQHIAWNQASAAAQAFWQAASNDARISQRFRKVCANNLASLTRLIGIQSFPARGSGT